eukprot:gene34589-biopygen33966
MKEMQEDPHQRTRDFCVVGKVLWRVSAGRYQLVLGEDSSLREVVLQEAHASVSAGHAGRDKTMERVLRRFWWKGAAEDVGRWVSSCAICQAVRPSEELLSGWIAEPPRHSYATMTSAGPVSTSRYGAEHSKRKGGEGTAHEKASKFAAQLEDARTKLELAQQRQRHQFGQRHTAKSFQLGDLVWVDAKHLTENIMNRESFRKLGPRWHGSLPIIERFFSDQ